MVFVDVVVVALLVGKVLGGRLGALAETPIRGTNLAFAAVALQVVAFPSDVLPWHTPGWAARALWLGSDALLIAMLVRNFHLRGTPILAAGLVSNLAAVLANGGLMPVRQSALAEAHRAYAVHNNSIQLVQPHLSPFVDRWAVPDWIPLGNVFSVGDLWIAFGIVVILVTAMRTAVKPEPACFQSHCPGSPHSRGKRTAAGDRAELVRVAGHGATTNGGEHMRRLVIGWDESGKEAAVLFDGEPPVNLDFEYAAASEIWISHSTPPDLRGREDTAAREWDLLPPPRGSAFRIATYPPGAEVAEHSTETLDYIVVIEGQLTLLIAGREITLHPGDTVVQQGTPHGWANRGDTRCVIAAILLSAVD